MSDFGWKADGIERAVACGGVALDVYRRPGFTGSKAVRRADMNAGGCGTPADIDKLFYLDDVDQRDPPPPS